MILLAQASSLPDPGSAASIGWITLSIAALCVALNAVMGFWKEHVKERPTPADTYTTKDEHREFQQKMDAELGRERSSRKKIHEEVGELQADTKSLRTETENQTRQLADLKKQIGETAARIDEIPARTIRMLNETKQLHK